VILSYRDLDERSTTLAYGLRDRGVMKGDRVAVSLGNNWEFAVTTYALFKLGAILVSAFDFLGRAAKKQNLGYP
jgi:non-ribosomal peptide synthetase component E (peptide arylation enzyme)